MDQLRIKDLEVYAYHGVFESEKQLGQKFVIDVRLDYDMTKAAVDHDLDASIHYGILSQELTDWLQASKEDLIETVAYQLVEKIFATYSMVQAVDLELKKPWAPIGLPLDTASVRICRKRRRVWIALGSNQGESRAILDQARQKMQENGITIKKASTEIVTKAWGKTDQADFLNQVVEVETIHEPAKLLDLLQTIEHECGRVRHEHWGPRTLDLDILFIGQERIYTDDIIVPHPYIQDREFVLKPMAEIAPHYIHPVLGQSMQELLIQLQVMDIT